MRRPAHALFGFTTPNLGDDLQALSIAMMAPSVSRLIKRERIAWKQAALRAGSGEPLSVVMNCWFMSAGFLWPPHASIDPIFHGFCIGRDEMMRYGWPSYLKRHEPIGCRDTHTVAILEKRGIGAYWSGCATLFLGRQLEPVAPSRRSGVYLVDIPEEAEALIPRAIRERAQRLSNVCPRAEIGDPLARMARAAAITDKLRTAELVITRRLHTALPCAGFGTPVALVVHNSPQDLRRFSGYDSFLPLLVHDNGRLVRGIDWNAVRPATIPEALTLHNDALRQRVAEKLGAVSTERLPSLAKSLRLAIPNPGLGAKPGEIRVGLGLTTSGIRHESWSDRIIEAELSGFQGLERFDTPVEVLGYASSAYRTVGPLSQFVVAGSSPRTDAPAEGRTGSSASAHA
jgi:hypothetical protein